MHTAEAQQRSVSSQSHLSSIVAIGLDHLLEKVDNLVRGIRVEHGLRAAVRVATVTTGPAVPEPTDEAVLDGPASTRTAHVVTVAPCVGCQIPRRCRVLALEP